MASHVPKVCEKTNEDRNVIPKAAKSWVKNSESTGVYRVLALKLLLKKPTRTFERSEIVKFGAPPKIFFQNFRKIFPKFLVLLELRFYLCSFSRNLSEYGGIVLKFQKFHESISWLYRAETAVARSLPEMFLTIQKSQDRSNIIVMKTPMKLLLIIPPKM